MEPGQPPELVSTGSLTSGEGHSARRRRWAAVLTLAAAAVLAGTVLVQQHPARHPASAAASPTASAGATYALHSPGATGRIQVVDVQRIETEQGRSALGLILRLDVSSGVQDVTTDSFLASDPEGMTTAATGLTVLVPGSTVVPAENGFRIAAPAALDLEVVVPVSAGVHRLSIVNGAQQRLAAFSVTG